MELKDFDPLDPNRHYKRVSKVLGVSTRIHNLALKKRISVKVETKEERIAKILVSWKNVILINRFDSVSFDSN